MGVMSMNVLVYGGGAVGLGLAACLIKAGARVSIVARPDTVAHLERDGLLRTGIFGSFHAAPDAFDAFASLQEIRRAVYDYVLVCTKSFDSLAAARDLAACPRLVQQADLVLCQNGWGNAELFCQHFDRDRVYNARVITGFYRPQKNQSEVTVHADAIHLGSLFHDRLRGLAPLARAISAGDIPCLVSAAIEKDLWAKMLYNCALNPLGAIFDVTYGTLGAWPSTRAIMDRIVEEIFAVMRASGYRTHWDSPQAYRPVFYEQLIPATRAHKSSTWQDIRANKRTEIDALNGAVIALGGEHGVAVSANAVVYNMVEFMQARNRGQVI